MNQAPQNRRPTGTQPPREPARRPQTNPQRTARPPMTDVERLARERRRRAKQKRARRAARITFVVVFVVLIAVTALIVFLATRPIEPPETSKTTDASTTTESKTPATDEPTSEKSTFLFDSLAAKCGFTTTGTNESVTYSYRDENGALNTISFTYGSAFCVVNGKTVVMDAPATKKEQGCDVPISLVGEILTGVSVHYDEKKHTAVIEFEEMTGSTKDNPKYEPITLRYQPDIPIIPPVEPTDPIIPDVTFRADLSAYEDAMNPVDRDAYLIIVNKDNPVSVDFGPDDLVFVPQRFAVYEGEYQARMRDIAARAYDAMLTEAAEYGIDDVKATLAYRNYWTQNYLVETYKQDEMTANPALTEEEAYRIVYTYCAPPGTSEHQTGLCTDMHNVWGRPDLELEDFENTTAYEWLRDNCWKFGFILRYPRGKEAITGYQFEAWHFRYVGRYHAYQIYAQGLCLEEYLAQLANS